MPYYQTNAVYERLEERQDHPFLWVSGNAWTLIYGDQGATPLACVLAFGNSWTIQSNIVSLMRKLAERARLPLIRVRFDDLASEITSVEVKINNDPEQRLSLAALREVFASYGLPVNTGAVAKAINDASSSAYHNWQRENLGAITVSDIDLFRPRCDENAAEVIELKRSYIPLEKWKPFQKDFANFNLLLALCQQCGLELSIAYNHRQKEPFYDDASRLSLFAYNEPGRPAAKGHCDFESFVSGGYR